MAQAQAQAQQQQQQLNLFSQVKKSKENLNYELLLYPNRCNTPLNKLFHNNSIIQQPEAKPFIKQVAKAMFLLKQHRPQDQRLQLELQ
jgi:hypothetical protein